ncbi:MAG TPA: hypothetical protein VFX70_17205 [Mycobacteriales bacterium]|nr:hypothetical protein [Mycobacteriales bacterium]
MAAASERPAGGIFDPAGSGRPPVGDAPPFGDALALTEFFGGYPDTLGGTVGDASGGMIGGVTAEPLTTDTAGNQVVDVLGGVGLVGGYPTVDSGYGDALSVAAAPARASTPRAPTTPPAPAEPARPAAPARRGPVPPDGVLRPPGWRPGRQPAGRRPRPATRTEPVARATGRSSTRPSGEAPARVSRSADDLPSGNRPRWVGRAILALVVAGFVVGSVAHGCASGLAGH